MQVELLEVCKAEKFFRLFGGQPRIRKALPDIATARHISILLISIIKPTLRKVKYLYFIHADTAGA